MLAIINHPRALSSAESKPSNQNPTNQGKEWHKIISAPLAGYVGAAVSYPSEALKKMVQTKQPITLNTFYPSTLYRGCTAFSISVTTATVTSMGFQRLLQGLPGYDPSSTVGSATSAIGGGMLGAAFGSTPAENVILEAQLSKKGPFEAACNLFKQRPTRLWVGLKELMGREAGFAGIMLWGGKAAREVTYEKTLNKKLANLAELSACLFGATVTHPCDRIATYLQLKNGTITSLQAIKEIKSQYGVRGFLIGLGPRAALFTICAGTIPRAEALISSALNKLDPIA